MENVIRAQLVAARASIDAALALFDAMDRATPAEPSEPEPIVVDGVCRHPNKLAIPGRPGVWVCRDCSFNHPPEEAPIA